MDQWSIGRKPKQNDFQKYLTEIYGMPGAGKSTLASHYPNAFFIATEPGLNSLEVNTFLDKNGDVVVMKTWQEFQQAVKTIVANKDKYKTIVVDTIDNAIEMCSIFSCGQRNIEHESDEAYGKGWKMTEREFKKVLDYLVKNGMGVVFISHAKQTEQEIADKKITYIDNTLPNSAKKYINGLVDFILFVFVDKNGNRQIRTKANPNFNAKDRTGKLPEVLELTNPSVVIQTLQEAVAKNG
jgi:AAA domain